MECQVCAHLIAACVVRKAQVVILSMIIFILLDSPLVQGQVGGVYLLGDNITLPCAATTIDEGELFTWVDVDATINIYTISGSSQNSKTFTAGNIDKYNNFDIDNNHPDYVNMKINLLELNDSGIYRCDLSTQASPADVPVGVEALPISVSISCQKPDNSCPSPSDVSSVFTCTCTAIGAYPDDLQLTWTDAVGAGPTPPTDSTERSGFYDYNRDATMTPTDNTQSITCTLEGYTNILPDGDRSATYNFVPPTCEILIKQRDNCGAVDITCECGNSANPDVTNYQFYDAIGEELGDAQDNEKKSLDNTPPVEGYYTYGCRGCNGVNFGTTSYVNGSVSCVPRGLETWVIIVIALVVVLAIIGAAVLVYWFCFRDKCPCPCCKSTTPKSSNVTKQDEASPGVDPEIPTYGVVNKPSKKGPKDPTPAPRTTSNDQPMQELQYADLDHGRKPASNEIIQPKDEPTHYAEVNSVIV